MCLPANEQPHKTFWDHDKTRYNMHTTGYHAHFVDKMYQVNYEDLEGLSIRQQRDIIKARANEYHSKRKLKNKF